MTTSDRLRVRSLLDSAIELGAGHLLASLTDNSSLGQLRFSLSNGSIEMDYTPENGRVDLNLAEIGLLELTFRYAGMTGNETRLIIEQVQSRRLGLGRGSEAHMAGTPLLYGSVDELLQYGLTKERLARVQELLTVFSGQQKIDPRNVNPEMFSIFQGLSKLQKTKLLTLNSSRSNDLSSWLEYAGQYRRYFTFEKSRVYRISTKVVLRNGLRGYSTAVIIFYPDDDMPYRLLWRTDST